MAVDSSSVNVEVLARADAYVVAAWRRVVLLIWKTEANAAGVEHSRRAFEQWVTRQPRGGAFLIVIPTRHAGPPDEKTREAMSKTAEAPCIGFKGMGTFIQAEGFLAATIRSIVMRLNVITGNGATNLFETANKAAEWAATLLDDPTITGVELAKAIRQAQEDADESSASKTVRNSA